MVRYVFLLQNVHLGSNNVIQFGIVSQGQLQSFWIKNSRKQRSKKGIKVDLMFTANQYFVFIFYMTRFGSKLVEIFAFESR